MREVISARGAASLLFRRLQGRGKPPEKPDSGLLSLLLIGAVVLIGGGIGYYFKIYKPKHEAPDLEDDYCEYEDEGPEEITEEPEDDDTPPWDDDTEGQEERK